MTFDNEDIALSFLRQIHWGNAAGSCRQPELAVRCAKAGMSAVVFGSITEEARVGNSGGDFYYDPRTGNSVNAIGLTNRGRAGYIGELPSLRNQLNALGTRLWNSVSSGDKFIPDEIYGMVASLNSNCASDVTEWNSSCPNVEANGKRKPPVCFSPADFELGVKALVSASPHLPVAVKISPITEVSLLGELVDICVKYDVNFLVFANTDGNCYLETPEGKPALPGMILGGLAGKALRPKVRGMIKMVAPKLRGTDTRIIAVGGIETGADAYEYLRLGEGMVVGFQFNTALSRHGENLSFVGDLVAGRAEPGKEPEPGLVDLLVQHGLPGWPVREGG